MTEEQAAKIIRDAWKGFLERSDDWHRVIEETFFYKANGINTSIEPNGISTAIEMHGFFFRTVDNKDGNTGFILNLQNRVLEVRREIGEINYKIESRYEYTFKLIIIPFNANQPYSYIKIVEGDYMPKNDERELHIDESLSMFSREVFKEMLMSSLLFEVC
jgi:hypothetical protein